MKLFIIILFFIMILFGSNLILKDVVPSVDSSKLICVNSYIKYIATGIEPQIADSLWLRFLQELDAFNQLKIADAHLCPNKMSSWHYHIIKVAMELDPKFFELAIYAPLLISVTISDSKGGSELFDMAVKNFPDDWRVLYRASYQAQIEERNFAKAADLLYRAGKKGAPSWVMSLAAGLYTEVGQRALAEKIYSEMLQDPNADPKVINRLKDKLNKKIKGYFESQVPVNNSSKGIQK